MLNRTSDTISPEQYVNDSLLATPSVSETVFGNLAMGIVTPAVAAEAVQNHFSQKPQGQGLLTVYAANEMGNEAPGMSIAQKGLGYISNIIGQALDPLMWLGGEAGGLVAKGAVAGVAKVAPDAATVFMRTPLKDLVGKTIGDYIPEYAANKGLGVVADKTLKNFGTFAGASVPQNIADNYNADTNHINWGGVAVSSGKMGALGIGIGAIPFAWGLIRGSINRGLGRDSFADVSSSSLDAALAEGHISPDEHQWFKDYLEHQNNPGDQKVSEDLQNRATQIISDRGHDVDYVNNKAQFNILRPEDMQNLQGVIADQLTGDVPDEMRTALSDFVVHQRLDDLTANPETLDGVRGYVDFIDKKLEARGAKSAEADQIVDDHLEKSIKERMPLDQKELVQTYKKSLNNIDHVKHLPISIPENVIKHIKEQNYIDDLESKNKSLFKEYEKTGNQSHVEKMKANEELIKELRENHTKILTPREELSQLREELLGKPLKQGFQTSVAYNRLQDLANVWHNARTLLDRVHLEHEYERQKAFRDLAKNVLDIADSNQGQLAKPENVMDYLKRRIEGQIRKVEPANIPKQQAEKNGEIPADADQVLKEQREAIEKSQAEDAKKDFNTSLDKYTEFQGKENVFKNLISCVLGGLNG